MTDVDAIVIGSGAGGLTAALCLAQAGKSVIVLEQHYLPGGWCHSFNLSGYRFSPGVHYIGEIDRGGQMRRIYEGLGLSADLEFCELNPDAFDHLTIGQERFDIPKGRERFADRLGARFPRERQGINGYLNTVDKLSRELNSMFEFKGLNDFLTVPFKCPTVARWGLRSTKSLIEHYIQAPLARAILTSQCGDHGLPPSLAPAAIHASVAGHYFGGGYYPRGGAGSIPRAYIRALRKAGGTIKVRTRVEKILIENRRAIGVRLGDGTEIRAKVVISNADPHVTFHQLVGQQHLSPLLRFRLNRTRYSTSALSLFMAVDTDLRARGLDSGNYWFYRSPDIEQAYRDGMKSWGSEVRQLPGSFLTCTTLKDPSKREKGHHTLESFAFIGFDRFKEWANTRYGERPESYQSMKRELLDLMIRNANDIVPGIDKHIVFADLGTPLTNQHYVASTAGNLYGTEKSRFQIGPFGFQTRTEIEGLLMCGASTLGHGVMGATVSGLAVAKDVLHCRVADMLRQHGPELVIVPSDNIDAWPAALRRHSRENAALQENALGA